MVKARCLKNMVRSTCPVCGFGVSVPFFDGGAQALATLGWPSSGEEARNMARFPLSFVRCVQCGHVFNTAFDYRNVPYEKNPNLMYNSGSIWSDHLEKMIHLLLEYLPERPKVVEIGCGEGQFLLRLAKARPGGSFTGYDPNGSGDHSDIEIRRELFVPTSHLEELEPDLIISRHVLEHMINPAQFLQELAFAAQWLGVSPLLFAEVPCIDRIFEAGRIADLYYEHNSQFTRNSFQTLLNGCSREIHWVETGYGDEVIYGLSSVGGELDWVHFAQSGADFHARTRYSRDQVQEQLSKFCEGRKTLALWGGTGKGAAFMAFYNLGPSIFPLVVDSDPAKVGTFVPGLGQEIRHRNVLLENPADVIVISTQWRARDIVKEIKKVGITYEMILIEHKGKLIDFFNDPHPYR